MAKEYEIREEIKRGLKRAIAEEAKRGQELAAIDDRFLELILDLIIELIRGGGCFDAFLRRPQMLNLFGGVHYELVAALLEERLKPYFKALIAVRSKASDEDLRRFVQSLV